ncbi:hypothetical protein PSH79_07165 [Pseudomonas sp. FP2196]|uniref:hypothetical protein n=1 Tax=Pseudomonas sp. FP2196 TaxID=2954086 RepID=UPI002734CD7E|nr:hypothetical protein [Pseudomonas sp. FP2196]WLH37068.1 hypothetical protein PSH79_07165 [Pseudomonas sp. FP2196]
MRYMKVVAQEGVEGGISVENRIIGFYESAEVDAVYEAKIDRFGSVQKLSTDNGEELVGRIERFMSSAKVDVKRMFDWNHRGNQNGKSMELIAEEHTTEGVATKVRFRFLTEDGQVKNEVTLSPETDVERASRAELELRGAEAITQGKKRRSKENPGSAHPEVQDTGFMNRLCKAYIALNW